MIDHPTVNVDEKSCEPDDDLERLHALPDKFRRWKHSWEIRGKPGARAFQYCADELEEVLDDVSRD